MKDILFKAPADTTVENGMIIAELTHDEFVPHLQVKSDADVEVDENQIITKPESCIYSGRNSPNQ